jgi:hypothetical protein
LQHQDGWRSDGSSQDLPELDECIVDRADALVDNLLPQQLGFFLVNGRRSEGQVIATVRERWEFKTTPLCE